MLYQLTIFSILHDEADRQTTTTNKQNYKTQMYIQAISLHMSINMKIESINLDLSCNVFVFFLP